MAQAKKELLELREQIKKYVNKRSFLHRSLRALDLYLHDSNVNHELINKVTRQFDSCNKSITALDDFLETIYNAEFESEFEDIFNERSNIDADFSKSQIKYESFISLHSASNSKTSRLEPQGTSVRVAKLPSITLPAFSGKFDEWISFREGFNSLIDSDQSLSPLEKLQFLKSCLKDEAAASIKYLELVPENYKNAKQILRERYENERIIVTNHIRSLFELVPLHKESYQGFRTMVDSVSQHMRSLTAMGRPVDQWDDLMVYLITSKLPVSTRNEWEHKQISSDLPSFKSLSDFLTRKCNALSVINSRASTDDFPKNNKAFIYKQASCNIGMNNAGNCNYCSENNHFTNQCPAFLKLSIEARIDGARAKGLCINCLRRGHSTSKCKASRCKKCSKMHNTLLHLNKSNNSLISHQNNASSFESNGSGTSSAIEPTVSEICTESVQNQTHSLHTIQNPCNVILSTCVVEIRDKEGHYTNARALLDSGSQINIVTKQLAERLGLKTRPVNLPVIGLGNCKTNATSFIKANIKSKANEFSLELDLYILDKISSSLPIKSFNPALLDIPKDIKLADPKFSVASAIDILIGAPVFYQLLCNGQLRTNNNNIILQKTQLGWLISGLIADDVVEPSTSALCNFSSLSLKQLDKNIASFWEIEHVSEAPLLSLEQIECERHFENTIKRNDERRFVVSLPWKSDPKMLGHSLEIVKKGFSKLEQRLSHNPVAKHDYNNFMQEYLELGHMKEISNLKDATDDGCFLPHHAVYKTESITTKIRVVFDASCKTSLGSSLNDVLMLGPVLQNDLFSILARFRFYKFVICSDINKMYRQILIKPEDTAYQKILHRFSTNEEIKVFQLKTLTYGTRPASFIATKCLFEIATSYKESDPNLYRVITNDFYMDDLITGVNDEGELVLLRDRLIKCLSSGGFLLLKWNSNNSKLLDDLESSQENLVIHCKEDDNQKTLGALWSPVADKLLYSFKLSSDETRITKRTILSHISKMFDPLGLLGPVITLSKLIMQDLWKLEIDWDESVPAELYTRWREFSSQLLHLSNLSIDRKVLFENDSQFEIHGFSDASERAYGACVFIREITSHNKINCSILCAKSRVAPLKTITIPRLELCAAVLLAELVEKIINVSHKTFFSVNYFTDSTITLCWVKSCPSRWKTFIANRVTAIQNKSDVQSWYHVETKHNPADMISRGLYPLDLITKVLWWNGPNFLHDVNYIPKIFNPNSQVPAPEAKVLKVNALNEREKEQLITFANFIFTKYSQFAKLIRVVATCRRFIFNCRNNLNKEITELTVVELNYAELVLIKMEQGITFESEIKLLKNSLPLKNNSKILSLSPFLDKDEVLRVRGRLRQAELHFDNKHPILLPKGVLCDLIIAQAHKNSLHSGVQGTLAETRLKYWPVAGRNCVLCFRYKPIISQPEMSELPISRLQANRPFAKVGTDFFGPFYIKEGSLKSRKIIKVYGCVFICMLTKAVHCELVERLTTEAFIAALKRFVARRGVPVEIFCDNGTNFVGATNELREICNFLKGEITRITLQRESTMLNIKFCFNVPKGPHFGGLWEAAVKAFKRHIFKIASNANLTFVELNTLMIEVEGTLNTRPLIPLSQDPTEFNALTPGHFLIGDNLRSVAEIDLSSEPLNRLSKWQYIQRLHQTFWSKWSKEYLQELQKRQKWHVSQGSQLVAGQLVIIVEDNLPSRIWKLGRVTEVHPGADREVRAATVRTSGGLIKRPAVKLCVLPIKTD